jgi:hypothetical protein
MDLKKILELLGQEHVPGDEMTGAFLEDAVASFSVNPAGATDALLDRRILTDELAIALARNLSTAEPHQDVRLVRKMLANAAGDIRAVKADSAMRMLTLAEQISDCSRVSSYFVQLMRHPNPQVRPKVPLLMGGQI